MKKIHTQYQVQSRQKDQKWVVRSFADRDTLKETRAIVSGIRQEEMNKEGLTGEWRILKLTTYEELVEVVE
jgi:hypothetical protein